MIHAYKLFDKNIVIDVYSGSVHIVDDVAYDAITMRENEDKSAVRDALIPRLRRSAFTSRIRVI